MSKFSRFRPGTPLDTFGVGAAGAAVSAQMTGIAGKTAYVTGFEVTWGADGTGTVTDTLTLAPSLGGFGSLVWKVTTVAGQGSAQPFAVQFPDPISADAAGHTLSLALGGVAGRASAAIVLHGFHL